MTLTLTKNAVPFLLEVQNRTNQNVLVQVINLKDIKNSKHFPCHISDGYRKIKAAINAQNQKFTSGHNLALIRIKQHSIIKVGEAIRGVQVQQYQIVGIYPEQIGDPVNYSNDIQMNPGATNQIQLQKLNGKQEKKKPIEIYQSEKKKPPIILTLQDEEEVTERRLKDSDKISDLYVDLQNWQIVCRITDINYKEFISKKSNKFTQILTIELMDRTGMKIQGTVFGDHAKDLSTKLSLNSLYRISRGQIREQSYQTNKGPKYSRFNITFNQNSMFTPLHDNSLIPHFDENAYYSVQQVLAEKDFDKQYDMVGILTDVGQQKSMTDRNGKSLTKRVISVSDPQNSQTIDITLWRDVKFDQNLKGKTVLLKNFKLNNYMNTLTLNSLFKSQIKALEQHRYRKFQQGLNPQNFKLMSQMQQVQQVDHSDECRTIKKLQNQIDYMDGSTIYSNLNAFVSCISFKGKWFYQSCPKCKKGGASSNSSCVYCGALIDEPISRFILPIEIADFTGSIWTTAFDEFASVLLKGRDINMLKSYDEVKLREQGQKRIFQQFRFRIGTKKQSTGSIKHTIVGKPCEICPLKVALQNIQRIYQYE